MEGAEDYVMDNNTNYDTAEYSFSDPDLSFSSPNFIGSPSGLLTSDTAFSGPSPSFPSVPVASIADQKAWMQTIIDMFELSEESEPEEVDDEAESAPVDMEAQNARTERLKTILPALDRLWWASSDFMADAAEKLADGSRDRTSSCLLDLPRCTCNCKTFSLIVGGDIYMICLSLALVLLR